jgi:lauroyl/myristoyl acyltransferase
VTERRGARLPLARGPDAIWRARPEFYSPAAWLVLLGLDLLPWPQGEDLLARLFAAKVFLRPARLRRVLRWARVYTSGRRERWRLALATCAHHGRVVGRSAIIGLRHPDQLRPYLRVLGEEHLQAASGGRILLGFHLGMPSSDVVLRMMGHPVRWLGGWRSSPGWSRQAWRGFAGSTEALSLSEGKASRGAVLLRALRILLDGGTIYMTADGGSGREAFRVPLPGGRVTIGSGWLTLRERTGATVLPVLAHLEGRTHVVTIHPPLPSLQADLAHEACREILGRLLTDYVRRFPEQCYSLAFRTAGD